MDVDGAPLVWADAHVIGVNIATYQGGHP